MEYIVKNARQLGIALRRIRKELNLSQNDICDKVGILQKTVSSIENGSDGTSLESLYKLINSLNCEIVIIPRDEKKKNILW